MLLLYVIGHFNQTVLMRKRETENKRETEKERDFFFTLEGGDALVLLHEMTHDLLQWPLPFTGSSGTGTTIRSIKNTSKIKTNHFGTRGYLIVENHLKKNQHSFNLQGIVKEITNGKFLSNFSTFLLKTEEKIWCSLQIIISTFHNYSKTITVK